MPALHPTRPPCAGETEAVARATRRRQVKFEEFADRYEWVSPLFLHDDDFEAMVQVAWRLHEKTKKTSPF